MPPEFSNLQYIDLRPHPVARSQAISIEGIPAGCIVVAVPALSTVLLPSEKGQRCDHCHRSHVQLRKCTGCASYWYCGTICQTLQWNAHHKKICKVYNSYIASERYQSLPAHDQLESMLLSHLVAEVSSSDSKSIHLPSENEGTPFATFMSLLPGPISNLKAPPICFSGYGIQNHTLDDVYSRFGNNNFAIHSHLVSIAHGIFPLASRLFNHSCLPNAAARYILSPSQIVRMEIVALRDIAKGEEVCLPYVDSALSQTRQQIFELTYGFHCTCLSCSFIQRIGRIPDPPVDECERVDLEAQLQNFIFRTDTVIHRDLWRLPNIPQLYEEIPQHLFPFFLEDYLAMLSENFSKTSHEGPYSMALDVGRSLLALYILIYPPNYPQVGMHLLEMAKTGWNAVVTGSLSAGEGATTAEKKYLNEVQTYLSLARGILTIFGLEGDEGGPLDQITTLEGLLADG